MKNTLSTIKLSAADYIRIIAGKPILIGTTDLILGRQYKLVNITTKTYMSRYLNSVLGDWSYWK
ncbi:MAG: hypothetical protein V7L22_23410 [Nostoc sp.]|uniref:hypothetical protein n=1 Tax=Nostoc sp. TaxID=1180 RepID=UPI002FF7CC83